MGITIRKVYFYSFILVVGLGCASSNETITICGNKFDVYKETEYDYEQKLNSTTNILCFHKSKVIAFAYQSAGFRNNDSNLVYTVMKQQNDSLQVTTRYNDTVFGYPFESTRYFRCLKNGLIQLYSNGNPEYIITKKTARKNKLKN